MKIAKLSLVAAVAVAGLSTANAQPLEQAIKNVDLSGSAVYRYDDRTTDNDTADSFNNQATNSYKVAVNLKSSVNEDLTFNTRTIIGTDNSVLGTSNTSNAVGLPTDGADHNAGVALSHANFAYTGLKNTTVIAGKQAVPSPFAVQSDVADDENNGTGVTALVNLGPVTVAGTYLNQTNLSAITGQDVAGLGLLGNVGPVALDGWYLNVAETSGAVAHDAYTVGAKAKVEMVTLTGRYSAIEHDALNVDTESLWKVGAAAKVGIFNASLDYGQTNDVNVVTTGVSLENAGADAETTLQAWGLNLEGKDDASLVKATVGVDLLADLNLSATYADLSYGTAVNTAAATSDAQEYYGQLTYKMGKNFMTYARFGQVEYDLAANLPSKDNTRGRLHVQYTF